MMSGATSTVSAGGEPELLRNLDVAALRGVAGSAGRKRHVSARRCRRHSADEWLQLWVGADHRRG